MSEIKKKGSSMLVKVKDNNNGSALAMAILIMAVLMIFTASFMSSVTASTNMDSNATQQDQAYLVAKAGMELFMDNKTEDMLRGMVGQTIKGYMSDDPTNNTWYEIKIEPATADTPVNVVCTGHYGESSYRLYRYVKSAPLSTESTSETTTQTTTLGDRKASAVDKSAIRTFDESGGLQAPATGGPVVFMGTNENSVIDVRNSKEGDCGALVGKGILQFASNASSATFTSAYVKGTLKMGHGIKITGDVFAYKMEMENQNATAEGNIYLKDYLWLTDTCNYQLGKLDGTGHPSTVIMIEGQNTHNGSALYLEGFQGTINSNVYVKGDVYIGGANTSGSINGDIYVDGNVIIDGNGKNAIKGNIYCTGTCNYTSSNISSDDFNSKWNAAWEAANGDTVKEVLDQQVTDNTVIPVTTLPDDVSGAPIITDITALPNYTFNGRTYYIVDRDCWLNFKMSDALGGDANKNRVLLLEAKDTGDPVDVVINGDFVFGYNNTGGRIQVYDHAHSGLIRLFLTENAANNGISISDVAPDPENNANKWAVEPINSVGASDANYVPNLYMFYTGTEKSVQGFYNTKNNCFPGYWLTPNLNITNGLGTEYKGVSRDVEVPDPDNPGSTITKTITDWETVQYGNCPFVHGMWAVKGLNNSGGEGILVVYNDPDPEPRQKHTYDESVGDVYKVPDGVEEVTP